MKKRKKEGKNENQKQGSDTITVNLSEVLSYFASFNSQPVVLMTGTKTVPLNKAARKKLR